MPRAAICTAIDTPLEVADIDLQAPEAGEVKVRLGASGVCHSDLSVRNGTLLAPLPAVLGHEGAGVVEDVGEGVDNLQKGDHVVISWIPQCGDCYFCARDQAELCDVGLPVIATGGLLDGTSRFGRGGNPVMQMSASGTFTEATVVPAMSAVKIEKDVPLTAAALIGCGVLTGFGAAVNTADIRDGDTVAVLGAGGVGLNVIQGARHAGADRIIAIDMVDGKLQTAQKFGATDLVNAGEGDATAKVMELTGQRGADVAFEVIGLQPTIDQAIAMTRRGGQTVLVGVPNMEAMVTIPAALGMIFSERQVRGCLYGSSNVHRDVPMLTKLYTEGKLMLDELVSREITLDQVNDAMDEMGSGEIARSVIVY
ncbi:MAG TPA: Zn-dependent alcohol dehydrogenase [Acidimicrobiia bacterium]|nr:Zn-dependent alcohol dehydrogenase [Acidimicrobiia bacterium]